MGQRGDRAFGLAGGCQFLVISGECKRDTGALAELAAGFDGAAMVFNDLLTDGQTQSGALLILPFGVDFSGKERLKEFIHVFCCNAAASVNHADMDHVETLIGSRLNA